MILAIYRACGIKKSHDGLLNVLRVLDKLFNPIHVSTLFCQKEFVNRILVFCLERGLRVRIFLHKVINSASNSLDNTWTCCVRFINIVGFLFFPPSFNR